MNFRFQLEISIVRFILIILQQKTQQIITQKPSMEIQVFQPVNLARRHRVEKDLAQFHDSGLSHEFIITSSHIFAWEMIFRNKKNQAEQYCRIWIHFGKRYPSEAPNIRFCCQVQHPHLSYDYIVINNILCTDRGCSLPILEILRRVRQIIISNVLRCERVPPFKIIKNYRNRDTTEDSRSLEEEKLNEQIQSEEQNKDCSKSSTTETKNLNRHFRSKLREILRQQLRLKKGDSKVIELYQYFKPNRVGFKQIRTALSVQWFNELLSKQIHSGEFLRRILNSIMNIQSKQLMLKYYPIIEEAIANPEIFTRWKH